MPVVTQVTTTKLVEGPAHLVVQFDFVSDGTELDYVPILSPTQLYPPRKADRPAFRIMQVWYGLVWFDLTLYSGGIGLGPQATKLWTLARDCDSHTDFRSFGGLIDRDAVLKPPVDNSGILLASTHSFDTLGAHGSVILELRKTND